MTMKVLLVKIGATALLLSALIAAALHDGAVISTEAQQPVQTCGQGVVLRADSSILIDGWKVWATPPTPGMIPPSPSAPMPAQQTDAPSKITIGPTVRDEIPVCLETAAGSRCVTLKQVRALALK